MTTSIYRVLNKGEIILRRTDKSKVFHLGSAASYRQKSFDYMLKTQAYQTIESGINPCLNHLREVLALVDPLLEKKRGIDLDLWKQNMRPNPARIELAHLYFIPKPHKVSTIDVGCLFIYVCLDRDTVETDRFVDASSSNRCLTLSRSTPSSHLWSSGQKVNVREWNSFCSTHGTVQRCGSSLVQYHLDYLRCHRSLYDDPSWWCSSHLRTIPLQVCQQRRIHGMTIDTLMKMARLVLDTNCFVYDGKYYRQIRGGAMGSPFTMTLANIYMLHWEQPLIEHQTLHNELYGRYIDDVFMTSNLSLDQINLLLDEANDRDQNIRMTRSIGNTVQFLDVSVENNQGRLRTTVHHKPAAEPYIVPFSSDHPRHMHRNVINGALLRAARLCSDETDFDEERLDIELMLLLNGYPPRFVSYHFKRFFDENSAAYGELHHKLIQQPTRRESEREESIQDHQPRSDYNKKEIPVYFTFESGPKLEFKKELRRLWRKHYIYPGSPMNNVTLKIGTQSHRSLHQLLVKKKPPRAMLVVNPSATILETQWSVVRSKTKCLLSLFLFLNSFKTCSSVLSVQGNSVWFLVMVSSFRSIFIIQLLCLPWTSMTRWWIWRLIERIKSLQ